MIWSLRPYGRINSSVSKIFYGEKNWTVGAWHSAYVVVPASPSGPASKA